MLYEYPKFNGFISLLRDLWQHFAPYGVVPHIFIKTFVKVRGLPQKDSLKLDVVRYSTFEEFDKVYVYPEFLMFFSNVRYLVKKRFKSFKQFEREIYAGLHIVLSDSVCAGYQSGYHKSAQYNWLMKIAGFLNQNIHEMLTVNLWDRDQRIKAESV